MQPYYFATERHGLREQFCVGNQRKAQAGTNEIGGEACGERRVGHDGGDIGDQVFGLNFRP
jgi:hypothetical protein